MENVTCEVKIQMRRADLPVMVSWTRGVAAVDLGGRHWAHDGVDGVIHEAVGHAVLLHDVLAYWSEMYPECQFKCTYSVVHQVKP